MEHRLALLTDRCSEILDRWTDTDQRHAEAIKQIEAKLTNWSTIENRLEQESLQRIREVEGTIEHEWAQIRQMHAEPVKQLRDQTAALGETCVAAANLALRGFERAEARFAALEADLQERLDQLSHDVQSAIADLKQDQGRLPALKAAPFGLEGVLQLHDEMRETDADGGAAALPAASIPPTPPTATTSSTIEAKPEPEPELEAKPAPMPVSTPPSVEPVVEPTPRPVNESAAAPEVTASLATRLESLEREVSHANQEVHDSVSKTERMQLGWRVSAGIVAVVIVVSAIIGMQVVGSVNNRLNEASTRAAAAEQQVQAASAAATKEIASTRAEADRQIAEARDTAQRAQVVSNVLASPDLIRFNLGSPEAGNRASAQVLFSRSHGMVLSASRLAPSLAASVYQVWLLMDGVPVSAGTIKADDAGRATLSIDTLPNLPRAVTGVIVTTEPAGGSAAPSQTVVLMTRRAPQ